jgi:hypothetical protein
MTRLLRLVAIAGCGAASAPRPAVSALPLDPPAAVLLVGESLTETACATGSPTLVRRRPP